MLAAQRVDAEALADDAEARGWIEEADRHRRLITRLDALLDRTEKSRVTSPDTLARVERSAPSFRDGQPVSFTNVAERAQISRTTLYRDENLRVVVEDHRQRSHDPRSLSESWPRSVTSATPWRLSPSVRSEATKNNCAASTEHGAPADQPPTPQLAESSATISRLMSGTTRSAKPGSGPTNSR